MGSAWSYNDGIVIDDTGVVLCDECPCEECDCNSVDKFPATVTLSITNSTCGIQEGDYTLTWDSGVSRYKGTIDCAAGSADVEMYCGIITGPLGAKAPGWVLLGLLPLGVHPSPGCTANEMGVAYTFTCEPFHMEGVSLDQAGGCCGDCTFGDSFDWEINE